MFFQEKLKSIGGKDYVLEVGPGGTPHPRSNVLLEKKFSETEAYEQRGHSDPLVSDKPVIFYEGNLLPFSDKEFDYVICSHVLEHVPANEFPTFISELVRVSKRGYIEFPTLYYDYIYNFPAHVTFLLYRDNKVFYMSKMHDALKPFSDVQKFFYSTADKGYVSLINDLKPYFFQGFEWFGDIEIVEAKNLNEVAYSEQEIQNMPQFQTLDLSIKGRIKSKLRKIKHKTKSVLGNPSTFKFNAAAKNWFKDNGDRNQRLNYDLNEQSVVFDVGGYHGEFVRDIYDKYKCTVYVFEPVPEFYEKIKHTFKSIDKIKVYNFGLAGTTKKISLAIEDNASSAFIKSSRAIDADLVSINDFLSEHNIQKIDLMKINIEGGEFELLDALLKSGKVSIISNIQVQFHLFVENAQYLRNKLHKVLKNTHSLTYNYFFIWENWVLKK